MPGRISRQFKTTLAHKLHVVSIGTARTVSHARKVIHQCGKRTRLFSQRLSCLRSLTDVAHADLHRPMTIELETTGTELRGHFATIQAQDPSLNGRDSTDGARRFSDVLLDAPPAVGMHETEHGATADLRAIAATQQINGAAVREHDHAFAANKDRVCTSLQESPIVFVGELAHVQARLRCWHNGTLGFHHRTRIVGFGAAVNSVVS
jgi:hypothetical protein